MRSLRLVAFLAIPAQVALAQQTSPSRGGPLTLEDAITTARQNNPQLSQTRNLVRDANATVRTTYGALLPSASANLRSGYTQGGTQYVQGIAIGGSGPGSYNSSYGVNLNYSIAPGALYAPGAAKANRAASEANVTSATEALRANVTTQYIQALEQQATAALNDTLVATAKGQLDLANAKMEVGAGTILDVRTAEVALGQAQVAALQAHNQARIEKLKLFQLMGISPDPDAQLTTQFTIMQPPASVDSLINLARRVNPDLAAKKSTQASDEAQVKVYRSTYYPSLNLSTGFGATAFGYSDIEPLVRQAEAQTSASYSSCLTSDSLRRGAGLAPRGCTAALSPSQVDALRQSYSANNKPLKFASSPLSLGVGISIPIFNNFQRESNLEQARVSRDNAIFDLKARELQMATDVTTAYLNLVTAQQTVGLRETTAKQATEALAFAEESYKVGAKTFLDVTTARGQYEQAQVARVNAVYDYHKAFAALESAVGRPSVNGPGTLMGKKAKLAIGIVAVLGLGSIIAASAAKRSNKAVEVRIEPVQTRDLVASVTASGQIRPQIKVDVASDVSGRIMKLAVKEGQMVSAGQFLLQIDPAQPQAAVDRAEAAVASSRAQLSQAQASLDGAQKNYDRSAQLKKQNASFVTDEQVEQLKTAVDVDKSLVEGAKHAVDQASASLNDAKSALSKTTIYAPMAGRITKLAVEQGETAVPGTFNKDAATLLTISDMSILETRVKVDETDVARVKVGDSAQVQIDAFPDTTFVGKVTRISNSSVKSATATSTDQAVDYEVTIQLLNAPADTRPDFSATAKVITDKRDHVLSVPIIALTVRENQMLQNGDTAVGLGKAKPVKDIGKKDVEGVFVVGTDNKVTFRAVKVGIAGEKHFQILSGLKDGERIVAGTYQAIRELKDGTVVRETKPDAKKPTPGSKS